MDLKIGDKLINKTDLSDKTTIYNIVEINDSYIILNDKIKIKLPFINGSSAVGHNEWYKGKFFILTDELLEEHNKVNCLIEISKINFTKFSYRKLKSILEIIKS